MSIQVKGQGGGSPTGFPSTWNQVVQAAASEAIAQYAAVELIGGQFRNVRAGSYAGFASSITGVGMALKSASAGEICSVNMLKPVNDIWTL